MSKIDDIVKRAKELKMDSIALTDHGVMYGVIEFYKKAKEAGIRPVIGCEMYLAKRRLSDKDPQLDRGFFHFLAFAKNEIGYKNLMKLVSIAHLEGFYYKPRIDKKVLREHSEGLIVTSGCLTGEIPRAILHNRKNDVPKLIEEYISIFGKENFYFEIQHHPEIKDQEIVNQEIRRLAREHDLPMVITADSHYPYPEDRDAHDVFLSIQTNSDVEDKERMTMRDADFSIKDPAVIWEYCKNDEDLISAFENTVKLAERCELKIEIGKPAMPVFSCPTGETSEGYLRRLCDSGLGKRFSETTPEIKERLEFELGVIISKGYADYFLIVQDFVNWAKEQGIVVNCRGSAAGSLASYALGITDINPLEYGLLFERFLNPDRPSMPDIDMDMQDNRRGEIISYVEQKYGKDKVAQILTFGVMKARLAVRDVARALGKPYSLGDQISKLIPFNFTIDEALESSQELKGLYDSNSEAKEVMDLAKRFEGVVRHASTHAAGIVIAPGVLTDYSPLQYAARGDNNICTQYEMHSVEDIGLVKMDFLGVANLTTIKNALRIIRKIYQKDVDIDKIPLDDKKSFDLISRGETVGLFQLESAGMQRYLKELKPNKIEDIVAMVALYRPGPMELIPSFINRKHGKEKITYASAKLEPILKETYGIGVYQEQMMNIAKDVAGYTPGEADILRKAIGKKIKELLEAQKQKLTKGMVDNGVDRKSAEQIWELFPPFARYGFNKSHAVSYARIAYQTAYLKANFPNVFMAAVLTTDFGDPERVAKEINECYRMGIKITPPSVNKSFVEFGVVPETGEIVFSLASIKGVGVGVAEAVQGERGQNGMFSSMTNFVERMPKNFINKKTMESLIKAGAFDEFADRAQLLAGLDEILKFAAGLNKANNGNQMGLFGLGVNKSVIKFPQVPAATKKEKLAWEKEFLGLYLSENPLSGYQNVLAKLATPLAQVVSSNKSFSGKRMKIAGVIASCQRILTKTGRPMLFSKLDDYSNTRIEVVVFPNALETSLQVWQEDNVVLIEGKLDSRQGDLKFICERAELVESI